MIDLTRHWSMVTRFRTQGKSTDSRREQLSVDRYEFASRPALSW
jgi:hypothetical protein